MKCISSKLHVRRCPLIYISKGNRYLRQSGCSFSFSVPCVREIVKVKSEKVKIKPKYRNVTRFSKLLLSAPQSSLKLVCEVSLRNNEKKTRILNSWIFKCWQAIDFMLHILHKFHNWLLELNCYTCALVSDIYIIIKTLYLEKPFFTSNTFTVAEICLYLYSNKISDADITPTPNAKSNNRNTRKFHSARRKRRKVPPYAKSKKEVSTATTEDADFQIVNTSDEATVPSKTCDEQLEGTVSHANINPITVDNENDEEILTSNRIIDMDILSSLFNVVDCPLCHSTGLMQQV